MDDGDELGDDIVEILSQLKKENAALIKRMRQLEGYLRDEGYGDPDDEEDSEDAY
jgi:hypothetical protein